MTTIVHPSNASASRLSTVGDVMSAPAITATPSTPYKQLVQLLDEHGISAVPVVDEAGRIVGIVSEADLLLKQAPTGRVHPFWENPATQRRVASKASASCAADVMTAHVFTVHRDVPIARAARLMRMHNVKRLPVTDQQGHLLGIVSRGDLLKPYLREDDDIRDQIMDTVLRRWLGLEPGTVTVAVADGAVSLGGRVERRSERDMAEHLAGNLTGVVSVDNRIDFDFDDTHLPRRTTEVRL